VIAYDLLLLDADLAELHVAVLATLDDLLFFLFQLSHNAV
jgi:hypothetical protein